jgi:hypothetical protein
MEEINKEIAELEKVIEGYETEQAKLKGEHRRLTVQIESLELKIRRSKAQKREKMLQLGVNSIVAEFLANNSSSKLTVKHIGKADGTYKDIWASCRKCNIDEMELFSIHDGLSEAIIAVCPKCKCEIDLSNLSNI